MNDFVKALLVGSGGFLGANARYWLGVWIEIRAGVSFPWHTLTINATGSLIMGAFMGFSVTYDWNPGWRLFFAVGVLGGYTTFSAFSLDAMLLYERGEAMTALFYVVGSVVLSILGLAAGLWAVRAFS